MANTCYNYLTIDSNTYSEINDKLINADGVIDFNILMPIPENVTELVNPSTQELYTGERDWAWENIGCPGPAEEQYNEYLDDGSMYVVFETQWAPPVGWFNEVCKLVVQSESTKEIPINLELEYTEYDLEFAGALLYSVTGIEGVHHVQEKYVGERLNEALGYDLPELTGIL